MEEMNTPLHTGCTNNPVDRSDRDPGGISEECVAASRTGQPQ
jgi:hypothetical protein